MDVAKTNVTWQDDYVSTASSLNFSVFYNSSLINKVIFVITALDTFKITNKYCHVGAILEF